VHFGIKPWEIEQLEAHQFRQLCTEADRIEREVAKRG
jgi:hypothetical protein